MLHIKYTPYELAVASCGIAMAYDVALWSMVAVKMYQLTVTSGGSRLVRVFYRDGPLYITIITLYVLFLDDLDPRTRSFTE